MPSPYTINVPASAIEGLQQKLALASFPDELDGSDWDYGVPLEEVRRLAHYWQTTFDWRKQEAELNKLPQFRTSIAADGYEHLDIHFVHQRSQNPNAIPLLFVHGWPGSYVEVVKLLPLLTSNNGDPSKPSFHIIAPSIPNFAWSSGTSKKGFGLAQHAETCHKLMQELGYRKYVTQGGDWGFYIIRAISLLYPESCPATHINLIRAQAPSLFSHPLLAIQHQLVPYSQRERKSLQRNAWFANEGSGYRVLQATKPQTLGYALSDSPVALLAWILEKLHDWTDNYPWTDDEILTWVSIYAFSTAGPAASVRIYYEGVHQPGLDLQSNPAPSTLSPSQTAERQRLERQRKLGPVPGGWFSREDAERYIPNVKVGLSYFPKDLTVVPRTWALTLGNVVYERAYGTGGHFAAHEQPEAIAEDLRRMYGKGGGAERVTGFSGY